MRVIAVVIGNNDYPDPKKLKNAINDARSMEDVFRRLGYDVIARYDCNNKMYEDVLRDFDKELASYDASIFFYAGHGFQEAGENYLPSIECQIQYADKYSLDRNSIRLAELLDIYSRYNRKTHIVILDACRRASGERGGNDSFAPVNAPQGTLIAFSTSPNSGADDEKGGEHSFYTQALLSYIGRENLAVEDLFKKVRRSVIQWTNNKQVPWEHTSLIGDFYFNTGQMVVSPQIPYHEKAVKDAEYDEVGEIANLINEIRSCDYNRQNPAIDRLWAHNPASLDKNQQFLFGRNLLQASDMSFSAQRFMNSLAANLQKYQTADGENHVLNGMLFEIYFDSHGEFRVNGLKRHYFEEVMALNKSNLFANSFNFIRTVLNPYKENLIYTIPDDGDTMLDVDITVREEKVKNYIGEEELYSIVTQVKVNGKDITEMVGRRFRLSGMSLQNAIAMVTKAPLFAISLHTNKELQSHIAFEKKEDDDPFGSFISQ